MRSLQEKETHTRGKERITELEKENNRLQELIHAGRRLIILYARAYNCSNRLLRLIIRENPDLTISETAEDLLHSLGISYKGKG